ncbi:acyl-CoA synthetase [Halothiobacillus sp. DCM-1]|uniref:LpxL/LpxP family acyltransferase n=1 Tax=Halothiobacillus sp. DCM-1 TaxID=3112558 RepID=UPI0032486B9B
MNTPSWQTRRERGSPAALRLMLWLSRRLGRSISRLILPVIALYFTLFAPSVRRAARQYSLRRIGRLPRFSERYRQILCFARTVHDRVFLLSGQTERFALSVENAALFDEPGGKILIGAHLGSFEALRAVGQTQGGRRVAMMMYPENAKKINEILAIINPGARADIIALGQIDSMLEAERRLAQGDLLGLLADRTLPGDPPRLLPFFGAAAPFAEGPFRIAALLRQPVLFMAGLYLGGNRYHIVFAPLADFRHTPRAERQAAIDAAMRRYVALLEAQCRAAPDNWFNFFEFWPEPPPDASIPSP